MGSKQTSKIVPIIFNIDSGGRGDLKEVRVILTNIFGEDCLGSFYILKSDVFVGSPFGKVIYAHLLVSAGVPGRREGALW